MSEAHDVAGTIEGLNRLLSDSLAPELQRQESAIEHFLEEARRAREQIHSVLEQAEAELTAPFESADSGLDEIDGFLNQLGSALDPSQTANTDLFETESSKAGAHIDDVKDHFEGIEQALMDARGTSDTATTTAESEVNALIGEIEAACTAFASGADEAAKQLDGANDRINHAVTAIDAALEDLQELVERSLKTIETDVDDQTKDVGSNISEMLDSARDAIGEFCDTSDTVLGDMSNTAEKLSEVFGGDAKEILDKVKNLLEVIEKIKPLLEAVEQWT